MYIQEAVVKGPNCSVRLREKAIVVPQNSMANIPKIVLKFSWEVDVFKSSAPLLLWFFYLSLSVWSILC
jgi:hypothetical protein